MVIKKWYCSKLDSINAYHKVNWDFLLECHTLRGFILFGAIGLRVCSIMDLLALSLITQLDPTSKVIKGGYTWGSPAAFLFNLVVDCLTKMSATAQKMI